MARITRRNVLKAVGLGGAAVGSLGFAPVRTAGIRPDNGAALGAPVEGPLAATYGRYGVPRGIVLGHVDDTLSKRVVTWQTTGRSARLDSDLNATSVVRYAPLPEDLARPGADPVAVEEHLRSNARIVEGTRTMAPSGLYEDDDGSTTDIPGEQPSIVHRAVMDLEAGATYAYQVGGSARRDGGVTAPSEQAFSAVRTCKPAPAAGAPFTFTHLGDHGTRMASRRVQAELAARDVDLHLVTGDISYSDGFQPTWDEWANIAAFAHDRIPLITTPGNHESKDYFGETYRTRFALPNMGGFHGANVGNQNYFGFTHGNVFFVSGSGGAFLGDTDALQGVTDLVNELVNIELLLAEAAVRRAAGEIDFLVYSQHFPLFTNEDSRGPINPEYVLTLEQMLQRYQVDLVLVGHDHMYQRSQKTVYGVPTGSSTDDGGPGYTQVIAGSGGKTLYEFAMTDWTEVPGKIIAGDIDENLLQFRGPWTHTDHLQFCFAEYRVSSGRMDVAGMIFEDFGGGLDEDPYAIPGDHTRNGDSPEIRDSTELDTAGRPVSWREPVVGDQFTVVRKADLLVERAAAAGPRTPSEIIGDLPIVRGDIQWRDWEDCTQHDH